MLGHSWPGAVSIRWRVAAGRAICRDSAGRARRPPSNPSLVSTAHLTAARRGRDGAMAFVRPSSVAAGASPALPVGFTQGSGCTVLWRQRQQAAIDSAQAVPLRSRLRTAARSRSGSCVSSRSQLSGQGVDRCAAYGAAATAGVLAAGAAWRHACVEGGDHRPRGEAQNATQLPQWARRMRWRARQVCLQFADEQRGG